MVRLPVQLKYLLFCLYYQDGDFDDNAYEEQPRQKPKVAVFLVLFAA